MKKAIKLVISTLFLFCFLLVAILAEDIAANASPNHADGTAELAQLRVASNTRGIDVPTATWDIHAKGVCEFAGASMSILPETLYTEYRFTGTNYYTIQITNHLDCARTVKCRRASDGKVLKTVVVPGHSTVMEALSTTHVWYLSFPSGILHGPTDVTGSVRN